MSTKMDSKNIILVVLSVMGEVTMAKADGVVSVTELIGIIRKVITGLGFGSKVIYKGNDEDSGMLDAIYIAVTTLFGGFGKGVSGNLITLFNSTLDEIKKIYADKAITMDELTGILETVAANSNMGDKAVYHSEYKPVLSAFQKLGGNETVTEEAA